VKLNKLLIAWVLITIISLVLIGIKINIGASLVIAKILAILSILLYSRSVSIAIALKISEMLIYMNVLGANSVVEILILVIGITIRLIMSIKRSWRLGAKGLGVKLIKEDIPKTISSNSKIILYSTTILLNIIVSSGVINFGFEVTMIGSMWVITSLICVISMVFGISEVYTFGILNSIIYTVILYMSYVIGTYGTDLFSVISITLTIMTFIVGLIDYKSIEYKNIQSDSLKYTKID